MTWKLLADAAALFHGLWVVAVLLGPIWAFRRPVWRGIHLVLLLVTAVAWSFYCPLTVLENVFLARFDPTATYQSGFLERWVGPVLDLQIYRVELAWSVRVWAVLWAIVYGIRWAKEAKKGSTAIPPNLPLR